MGFSSLFHRKKRQNQNLSSSSAVCGGSSSFSPDGSQHRNSRFAIEEIKQVFNKFDVNGDGKISSTELGQVMSSLGCHVNDDELNYMIREVDSDGDGFIDFDEFVELNTKGIDSNEALENLKQAFSVYDIDGNGSISAEELHQVLKSLGDQCPMAECRKMINGVDRDGDGMIDFQEFKVMMMMGSTL
ncbi:hypothetical protein ACFE04_020449 [Oxalis oulophora]